MSLFLFRFWPVLIPLLIYWLWHINARQKAKKSGSEIPLFRNGPWYQIILASLFIGFICFLYWGLINSKNDGNYIPPHMKNGKIIPGHIEP